MATSYHHYHHNHHHNRNNQHQRLHHKPQQSSIMNGPTSYTLSSSFSLYSFSFKSFSSLFSLFTSSLSSTLLPSIRHCSFFLMFFFFLALFSNLATVQCSETIEPNALWWNDFKPSSNVSSPSSSSSVDPASALAPSSKLLPNSLPLIVPSPIASYSINQSPIGLSSSIYTPSDESLPFGSAFSSSGSGSSFSARSDNVIEPQPSVLAAAADDHISNLGPSDDELMTQASRLNSKMTRIAHQHQSQSQQQAGSYHRRAAVSQPNNPKSVSATKFDDSTSSADDIFDPVGSDSESDLADLPDDTAQQQSANSASPKSKPSSHVPAESARSPQFSQFGQQFQRQQANNGNGNGNGNSNNRIWTYFDSAFNNAGRNQRPSSRQNDNWRPNQNQQFRPSSKPVSAPRPAQPDSIARQFRQTRPKSQPQQQSSSKSDKGVLNFNFNRRKNPEEKEKWRQLIQSIFDSTPRSSGPSSSGSGYGNSGRNGNSGYSYKSKTKMVLDPVMSIDDGKVSGGGSRTRSTGAASASAKSAADEESLPMEEEMEQNNLGTNANNSKEPVESEEVSGLGSKEEELVDPNSSEVRRDVDDEDEEEEDEDAADNARIRNENNNNNDGGDNDGGDEEGGTDMDEDNERRSDREERAGLDEGDAEDDDDIDQEANQYVRKGGNKKKQSKETNKDNWQSFGNRINRSSGGNRSNQTRSSTKPTNRPSSPNKPNFTMRFSMNNNELFDTANPNKKQGRSSSLTTPSSVTKSATESLDGDREDDEEDDDNGEDTLIQTTTTAPTFETSTFSFAGNQENDEDEQDELLRVSNGNGTELPELFVPKLKRKQQQMGKWMDIETFELKDDNAELDDENDLDSDKSSESVLADNRFLAKSMLKKKALMPPPRSIRQNSRVDLDDNDSEDGEDDSVARLARALPGTPGEDYAIFGRVPQTDFNCRDHKWPGYYADVETKCQVFHICQQGGRMNSFLCPNGTMFNQQLFVCDWWHNVQCDDVAQFYDLNEMIYDHNWESKRVTKDSKSESNVRRIGSVRDSSRQVGNKRVRSIPNKSGKGKGTGNDLNEQFVPATTTTEFPTSFFSRQQQREMETTTIATNPGFTSEPLSLTESVFGNRPNKKSDKRSKNSSSSTVATISSNSDKTKESLQLDQGSLLSTSLKDQNRSMKNKRFLSSTKGGTTGDFRFSRLIENGKGDNTATSSVSSSKKESPFLTRYKFVSGQNFKRQAVGPASSSSSSSSSASSSSSSSSSKSQPKSSIASILSSSRLQAAASANTPTATAHIQAAPSYLTGAFRHRGKYYRT